METAPFFRNGKPRPLTASEYGQLAGIGFHRAKYLLSRLVRQGALRRTEASGAIIFHPREAPMTRNLARYSDDTICAAVTSQRTYNEGASDQLIADMAAVVLTYGSGDEVAERNAADQVMAWMAKDRGNGQ